MRFMSMVKSSEDYRLGPPPQSLMDAVAKLGDELTKAGIMVGMGGLMPSSVGGFRVRQSKGRLNVIDGPFTEAKEVIGGFAIFEVANRDEAMALTRRFMELHRVHWPEFEGESELRPMFEPGEGP